MVTTTTIINDAAELVKVKGETQQLPAARQAKYLRILNQMIQSWRNNGIDLGLDTLIQGETVYVDEADEMAITYGLVELIAESANKALAPYIQARAGDLKASLRNKYFTQKDLDQDILLLGSSTSNILTGP